MEARINAAVQLEANVSSPVAVGAREGGRAERVPEADQRYAEEDGRRGERKEYALNRVMLETMIGEAKKWFDETSRRADVEAAVFRARLAELEKQIEAEMARFHAEREIQLEKERVERERLERIRAAGGGEAAKGGGGAETRGARGDAEEVARAARPPGAPDEPPHEGGVRVPEAAREGSVGVGVASEA